MKCGNRDANMITTRKCSWWEINMRVYDYDSVDPYFEDFVGFKKLIRRVSRYVRILQENNCTTSHKAESMLETLAFRGLLSLAWSNKVQRVWSNVKAMAEYSTQRKSYDFFFQNSVGSIFMPFRENKAWKKPSVGSLV